MNLANLRKLLKSWPMPVFATCGSDSVFSRPRYVSHPSRISLGKEVYIGKGSSLGVVPGTGGRLGEIKIGDHVWITSSLTLYCELSVTIEDNVLIAGGVFISDASHGRSTAELPYRDQPNEAAAPIVIGEGAWLGQNCVIMPGVTIGRRCIIGSNSVVTTSLPPGSVAVGALARVVKQWDWEAKVWRKVLWQAAPSAAPVSELIASATLVDIPTPSATPGLAGRSSAATEGGGGLLGGGIEALTNLGGFAALMPV